MSRVSAMNGRPLLYRTLCDFDRAGRRSEIRRHTTLGAALRMIHRDTAPAAAVWGSMWVEDNATRRVAGPFHQQGPRPSVESRRAP